MSYLFNVLLIAINYLTSLKQTHLFFVHLLEYHYIWIIWIKKVNHFQTAKVQPNGAAQLLFNILQFWTGFAHKCVSYNQKSMCIKSYSSSGTSPIKNPSNSIKERIRRNTTDTTQIVTLLNLTKLDYSISPNLNLP